MGKIIFTGTQIDEAIRKVKAGYADVSKVTAKASEVRKGKKFVDSNKIEQEGTIEDAEVKLNSTILSKSYLANDESNYPIVITPTVETISAGYINKDIIGEKKTLYIQTEEKKVTPSGETQKIKPTSGKLLTKVTVDPIPEAPAYPIENFPCPYFRYYITKSTSGTRTIVKIASGTVADNIYVKPGVSIDKAKVYIIPITTSPASTYIWGTATLINSVTHRLRDDALIFEPGDKFACFSSNFTPKGTFEYKTNGHLTFTFEEDFTCLGPYNATNENANYATMALFLFDGTTYYGVILDAAYWSVGTQYIGTKTTGAITRYTNCGLPNKPLISDGVMSYNLQSAGCLISNYAPIYYEWNYVNDSTSYHLATMTHGEGTKFYIPRETQKLDDPTITLIGDTISWNQVEDAVSYSIYISGKASYTISTTETSYNLSNKITSGGTYYVKVRAIGSVLASDCSNQVTYILALSAPVISLNQNVLSWNAVTNATSYYVYKDGSEWFITSSTSIDLLSYSLDGGSYSISVKAYASNWDLSASSNLVLYTRLSAPSLVLSEAGILSWVAVENATTYKLEIDDEVIANSSTRIYDLNDYIVITDSHVIKVTAYGNGGACSSTSKIYIGCDGRTIDTALPITLNEDDVVLTNQVVDDTLYPSKFYKITANTSGTYYIYCECALDTYGTLYNSNKEQYATSDDDYNMSFCFSVNFEAGDVYYLAARQYSNNTFEFDLHISTTNPNG